MKNKIKTILWVLLIVFLGFRLRLIGISKPSGIWFDEMIVYLQALPSFPVGIIKNLIATDILMPFYQLCLAVWMKIFGNGDLTLRMFSAVLGSLSIIGVYLTGNKAKDEKVGYLAAILLALNGCSIYFSQEVKFYIMAMFFCTFNLYFFLKVSDDIKNKTGWFGLILTNVLGCYTFSIFVFLAFVEFAYLFFENLKNKEGLKYFWINSGIITTLLIPFVWLNIFISHNMKNAYAPSTMFLNYDISTPFYLLVSWVTPYTSNKLDNYIHYFDTFTRLYSSPQAVLICSIVVLTLFAMIFGAVKNKAARKLGIVCLACILMTTIGGFFLNFCLTVRYGVLFIPFFVTLTAIGLCEIKIGWLRKTLISILIVVLLFTNVFSKKAAAKMDRAGLKPVTEKMEQYKLGHDDIVFWAYSRVDLFDKYYKYDGMIITAPIVYSDVAYESFGIKRTDNIKNDFRAYLMSDEPTVGEKNFFDLNIDNNKHNGHYIMFIKGAADDIDVKGVASDDEMYATRSFYFLPPYKFLNNIIKLCEKKFGPGEFYNTGNWHIFVYKIK